MPAGQGPGEGRDAPLLRFITCGSVDDGKSTLIGRLLLDTRQVPDDQLAGLETAEGIDPSRLLDGLSAEREQGITIDVAYRFFSTARRSFIVADTPGHEQYTRNMVTGASTADLALILVDASKGVQVQTLRHSLIARLLGVRHLVLAVNKMDRVGYGEAAFRALVADYASRAAPLGIEAFTALPLCGLKGDNVCSPSPAMAWHHGPSLLQCLETAEVDQQAAARRPFRMPVQSVIRQGEGFRGVCGLVAAGRIAPGAALKVMPSGRAATLARIVRAEVGAAASPGGEEAFAVAGQSATLQLAEQVDCGRGDVLVAADDVPEVADQFEATLIWMAEEPMVAGRTYDLKLATQTAPVQLAAPKHRLDVNTGARLAASTLGFNDIGVAVLSADRPLVFEPYSESRTLGGFILIERATGATAAAGLLHFALRRTHNIHPQRVEVDRDRRARLKGQRPAVVWLTGLSGAGKSTIANLLDQALTREGRHSVLLDGDNLRHGLNRDLGFTEADRVENIRRVGEVARLMTDAGLIVITAFISPFRAERERVRALMAPGEFIEVHVDTPLAVAEGRDVKGLYAKARRGELKNFTGIDSPYEPPESPELHIDTTALDAEAAALRILQVVLQRA